MRSQLSARVPTAVSTVAGPDERVVELSELLARVALGDDVAFAAVYQTMSAAVFGLACRVVRDPCQAQEVTQEVFIHVWRSASRFDQARGSARAWVLTIAHRRSVDRVRSAQALSEREHRAAQLDVVHEIDDVVEEVERRLAAQSVRCCLDSLTKLQRESVGLAYYEGHTYVEVAQVLDLPLGTVKSRLRDGLIRLRHCLDAA